MTHTPPEHICECCGNPCRVDWQGCKPVKVDGQIVYTAYMPMVTCWTRDCKREGYTFTLPVVCHVG